MSAFQFRVGRFGFAYPGIGGIVGWKHLFWRVWYFEGNNK